MRLWLGQQQKQQQHRLSTSSSPPWSMSIVCTALLLIVNTILIKCQDKLDGIDEKCPIWSYQCRYSKECIPHSWVCDGETDCGEFVLDTNQGHHGYDTSDEQDCSSQNMTAMVNRRRCNRAGFVPCPGDTNTTVTNNTCIAYEHICDGHRHCPNGSDEPDGCKEKRNICWAVKCPPTQKCVIDFEGNPLCICATEEPKHQKPAEDCFDVTDCHERCAHQCHIDRTRALWPLVTCKCQPGYRATNGGTHCLAINEPENMPPLLITHQGDHIHVQSLDKKEAVAGQTDKIDLLADGFIVRLKQQDGYNLTIRSYDFNFDNNTFCVVYSLHSAKVINNTTSSAPPASGIMCTQLPTWDPSRGLLRGDAPWWWYELASPFTAEEVTYLAYDWYSHNWYCLGRARIFACDSKFAHCANILGAGDGPSQMLSFVLDPPAGHFYVAFYQSGPTTISNEFGAKSPSIYRYRLDGSEPTLLLDLGVSLPANLLIDLARRRLQWLDLRQRSIYKYDLVSGRLLPKVKFPANALKESGFELFETFQALGDLFPPGEKWKWYHNMSLMVQLMVVHRQLQPKPVGFKSSCEATQRHCQHICTYNGGGGGAQGGNNSKVVADFTCLCSPGYNLVNDDSGDGNGGECIKKSFEPPLLLYLKDWPSVIKAVAGQLNESQTIRLKAEDIVVQPRDAEEKFVAIDYHHRTNRIFYSDVHSLQIRHHTLSVGDDRPEKAAKADDQPFVSDNIIRAEAIAIDWQGGNLYWTDSGLAEINVASLANGNHRLTLIKENVAFPRSLVLYHRGRYLFWSDWGKENNSTAGTARIERAQMDGVGRMVVVEKDVKFPVALTIDSNHDQLYWCDSANRFRLERINFDGTNRTVLYQSNLGHPYAMSFFRQALYVADYRGASIKRFDLQTKTMTSWLQEDRPIIDLKMIDTDFEQGTYEPEICTNLQCDHLCLVRPIGGPVCRCSDGFSLDDNQRTCHPNSSYTRPTFCSVGQFQCRKKPQCVDKRVVCDGEPDCRDGSDEDDKLNGGLCSKMQCADGYFKCDHNRCIKRHWVCDGVKDCLDGSDEQQFDNCRTIECGPQYFQCAITKRCIPKAWVCDRDRNCGEQDLSDETNCTYPACDQTRQFRCHADSFCISRRYVCDGEADCVDGSDEHNCAGLKKTCDQKTHFECDKGNKCLPKGFQCNGIIECVDGSDEKDCRGSTTNISATTITKLNGSIVCRADDEWMCGNGHCILRKYRCDGKLDCVDGSDEDGDCGKSLEKETELDAVGADKCSQATHIYCQPTDSCLVRAEVFCDGRFQCPDGSDERNCKGAHVPETVVIDCRQPDRVCRDRQTNETICLPVSKLCDNRFDCAGGEDEGGMCSDDLCFFSQCQGTCRNSPTAPGFVCLCPNGSRLGADGTTCELADPCDWGTCSQVCETIKPYRYKCSCLDGYQLDPKDMFTCKSNATATPLLIFSQRHELRLINLQTSRKSILRVDLKNAVAIDYLWQANGEVVVYWADALEDKIFRGDLLQANTLINVRPIAEGGLTSVEGLAVDWLGGNIYWVDSDFDRIEVARADGKNRKTLISENVDGPRAISLDPLEGTMFWTDWHAVAPRIEAASMDGQQRRVVVRVKPGSWPNGLTLDLVAKRVYWIDAKADELNTVRYDGGDLRRILHKNDYLTHPFAISLYGNQVFWTDWSRSALVSANKWNGTNVTELSVQLEKPFDVKIVHPSRQPKPAPGEPPIECAHNNGGCSHLCLLSNFTASGRRFTCTCPHTMRLREDNRTCILNEVFLLVGRQSEVRGVDLENSKSYILPPISLPKVLSPVQIDFVAETKEIFWADSQFNEIKKLSLSDGSIETVIDAIIQQPTTFAIDWLARNMYIVSKNVHDHVTLFDHDHDEDEMHRIDNMKTAGSSPAKDGANGKHYDYIDSDLDEDEHYHFMMKLFGEEENVPASIGHEERRRRRRYAESMKKAATIKATLYLCNLRGEYLSDITPSINFTNPRSLALDPYHGRLYWAEHVESESSFSSAILTARLDGSQPFVLSQSGDGGNLQLNKPASLQVDHYNNQSRLYWVNLETRSIQYLVLDHESLDGNNPKAKVVTLDTNNGWATFDPYALTIFGNRLFVAYSDEETIRVMDKIDGRNDQVFMSEVTDGLSLRLYDAKIQKMGSASANLCAVRNGGCEQLCVAMGTNKRRCLCAMGFQRSKTSETACTGSTSFLMYSYSWGVRAISTVAPLQYQQLPLSEQARKLASLVAKGKDKSLLPIMSKILMASSIDFDARRGMIIWSDSDDNSLSAIRHDSSGYRRLLTDAEQLGDFTYDWNAGNLYWFQAGGIFMVNIWSRAGNVSNELRVRTEKLLIVPASGDMDDGDDDGESGQKKRRDFPQLGPLNSITIHPGLGKLYWTSQSPVNRSTVYIEQANLDGSNRRVLVEKRKAAFGDLVVDFVDHFLYFTESNEKLIQRIPLQHPELAPTTLLTPTIVARGIKNPVSLAIDNVHLYWSDIHHYDGAIFQIKRPNEQWVAANWSFSVNATEVKLLERGIGDHLKDLNVYQQRPIYRQNPCTEANGGCEQFCFYLGVYQQHRCGCAYGYISAIDGRTCLEYDVFAFFSYDNKIESIKMVEHEVGRNESQRTKQPPYKTIELPRTLPPEGAILAHDYNHQRLFYARSEWIASCYFNGTGHQAIVQPLVTRIEQMLYDPTFGTLFWRSDRLVKQLSVAGLLNADGQGQRTAEQATSPLVNASHVLNVLDFAQLARIRLGPMAIDHCTGTLYWSNVHIEHPSIYRMLNHQDSLLILDKDVVHFPVAMVVDAGRWLYWVDGVYRTIMRCNLFGAECNNLAMETSSFGSVASIPRQYLTVHTNWLYWMTRGGGLYRLNLKTKKQMLWKQLPTPPTSFVLVAPYLNNQTMVEHCVASRDSCAHQNGGCDDICLNWRNGTTVQCACYEGRVLAVDQRRCLTRDTECLESKGMFECRQTAQCIPYELTCDEVKHCFDGTDEDRWMCATRRQCPQEHFFTCTSNGRCVPKTKRCDGVVNCADASDELGCPCEAEGKFKCKSDGICIDNSLRCNSQFDCRDGSDEQECAAKKCPVSMVACLNLTQQCVYISELCDGVVHCLDETDEVGRCEAYQARYHLSNETIGRNRANRPKVTIVQGLNKTTIIRQDERKTEPIDSDDNDECGDEQFRCKNGECISAYFACDGNTDCGDGSDEGRALCTNRTCPTAHYRCLQTGQCIPKLWVCDGEVDCSAGDDEVRFDEATNQSTPCDPSPNRRWYNMNDPEANKTLETFLMQIDSVLCRMHNRFRCANGNRCVPRKALCDGQADCPDRSDEELPQCSAVTNFTCGEGQYQCRNTTRCIPALWLCNGIRDCSKNDDEDWRVCGRENGTATDGLLDSDANRTCTDRFECDNGDCIEPALICNGANDCGDFSDEKSCNVNECEAEERVCAQKCEDMPIGYRCSCYEGFQMLDGGRICQDIDECSLGGGMGVCAQKCLNKYGSFECSCHDGYRLEKDGRTCRSEDPVPAKLLVTTHHSIMQTESQSLVMKLEHMNLKDTDILFNGTLNNAVAIDFDWRQSCLYWSEITIQNAYIKRLCEPGLATGVQWPPSSLNETQIRSRIKVLHSATLSSPDGLAVDWIGRNLYWCDKGRDTIEVSRLDGTLRRVLIRRGLDEPRAIVVNPLEGILFWSDWGERPHIGRANMDGTGERVLLDESLGWPNALTIDYIRRELYFADAQLDYIAVVDFEGRRRTVLFDGEREKTKFTNHIFAMTTFEGRLYWTDWHSKALVSCPVLNCTRPNLLVHLVTIHRPMDLKVLHRQRQPALPSAVKNPCPESSVGWQGCRSLCLIRPRNDTTTTNNNNNNSSSEIEVINNKLDNVCACPENFVLNEDGSTCRSNCSKSDFVCQNTYKCIPFYWLCDSQDDCGDGSDEPDWCPPFHCQPGQYQCRTKALECISPSQICDGTRQCSDGTDEHECDDYQCMATQFKCPRTFNRTSYCISANARCDGVADCVGGEDEKNCECPRTAFKCNNNRCISKEWKCDGDDDCGDGSDEARGLCTGLNCTAGEYRCLNGPCIPATWRCDQDPDCMSQDDEEGCEEVAANNTATTCSVDQFRCRNGQCIFLFYKCDLDDDCGDGSDEENCPVDTCQDQTEHWKCPGHNGRCIHKSLRCDGNRDCADGADELDCKSLDGCSPNQFKCKADPTWGCMPESWRCDGQQDCLDGSDESSGGAQCLSRPQGKCGPGEFRCNNGLCIIDQWRCDGQPDCSDGSDEGLELCRRQCPPFRFPCMVKRQEMSADNQTDLGPRYTCISQQQMCDGHADCLDDEREVVCKVVKSRMCTLAHGRKDDEVTIRFQCANQLCLDPLVECDGRNDCGDNSDEMDCPTIHRRFHIDCPFGLCSQGCVQKKRHKNPQQQPPKNPHQSTKDVKKETHAYRCECAPGYSVVFSKAYPDSIGCRAVGSQHALLLATLGTSISFRLFDPHKTQDTIRFGAFEIEHSKMDASARIRRATPWRLARSRTLDVIHHNRSSLTVFWADAYNREILQLNLNNVEESIYQTNGRIDPKSNWMHHNVLLTDVNVKSLAVDWVMRNIYWFEAEEENVDHRAKLMVAKIVSHNEGGRAGNKTTLIKEGLNLPDDLIVDPKNFYLYWTDWAEWGGQIRRSTLDGTRVRTLVHGTLEWPLGLALDLEANYLYWSDAKKQVIQAIRVDGADRRLIYSFGSSGEGAHRLLQPARLAMFEDTIYVSMLNTQEIYRLNKFGRVLNETTGERIVKISRERKLAAMNVLHYLKQRPLPSPCDYSGLASIGEAPHSHCEGVSICLGMGPSEFRCLCPDGFWMRGTNNCRPIPPPPPMPTPAQPHPACPCLNNGRCRHDSKDESIFCECTALFTGKLCEQFRCAGHCHNNGLCYYDLSNVSEVYSRPGDVNAERGAVRCMCHTGWTGEYCSKRVDRCSDAQTGAELVCHNNATCSKLDKNRFHCNCLEGFGGDECERCADWPVCQNGGVCERHSGTGRPVCRCRPGFAGQQCEQHLCSNRYCHNKGTCTIDATSNWRTTGGGRLGEEGNGRNELWPTDPIKLRCQCSEGYTGERCNEIASFNTTTTTTSSTTSTTSTSGGGGAADHEIQPSCIEHQCHNKGQCHVTKATNYRPFCECQPGYGGEHCELLEPNTINVDGEESRATSHGQHKIVEPKRDDEELQTRAHGSTRVTVYVVLAIVLTVCVALFAFRFHDAICKSIQSNLAFQHRRIDDQSMISLNETGASSRGTMDIMNPIFDRNAARNHDDDDDDEGATVRIYGNANREFVVDYKNTNFSNPVYENQVPVSEEEERANLLVPSNEPEA